MAMPNMYSVVQEAERQGYFERCRQGDPTAASLFTRLCAYLMNPNGDPTGYGWLTKQPGENNIDGYSIDAIVYTNNQADLMNVADIITGAEAPGATTTWQAPKPRRAGNRWEAPKPLTSDQLLYLRPAGPPQPKPPDPPQPKPPAVVPYDEPWLQTVVRPAVVGRYQAAKRALDDQYPIWMTRTLYDHVAMGLSKEDSLTKHLKELNAALGLPNG